MKHSIKRITALTLQTLIRQPWARKTGQVIANRLPWLKRRLLTLLYSSTSQNMPEKIQHTGLYETRLQDALRQRQKGNSI